jgi:glycosyltransferase involved in cell wall biosynthesis
MDKPAPEIVILSFTPIHRDGRVLRQVEYLSKHFRVTVVGYGHLPASLESRVRMLSIEPPTTLARRARKLLLLPLGRLLPEKVYPVWYWREGEYLTALNLLSQIRADIIHANDWESLPVAARAARGTAMQVVLDLHEYAPLMRENRWYWRVFYQPSIEYFLRKYIPCVSASVTVNQTIAERYAEEYGLRPIVVMNAPKHASARQVRRTDPEHISLVHHGHATRDRKLELMIEALAYADTRYTLHFFLIERSRGYVSELQALAQRLTPGRVFFHQPPLPMEIVGRITMFDMGIFLLPFSEFNSFAALPNKFFEFIAAGLAVCVGPSPEMASLTREFGLGIVVESFDPENVARVLNSLSASDIDRMKLRAIGASELLNADTEMAKLVDLYRQLLKQPS